MGSVAMLPARLWQVGIPAFAAVVGVVAGVSPKLGLAAALGAAYASVVLADVAVGVALFVALAFLESISAFGGLSLAKAAGGLLALSWIALITTERDKMRRRLLRDHPVVTGALVLFGAWAALSAVWAELPTTALDSATRWILNLVLFPIVYTAVRQPKHVRWVFALFIIGALVSAAVGLATGGAASAEGGRLGGSGVNANELGELLIPATILAAALGACRDLTVPVRAAAFGASGLSALALLMTVSRGAMVGLAVALLIAPLLVGPGRRLLALTLVALVVAGSAAYFVALAPATDLQRIAQSDSSGGSGRTSIWKVGWRMVEAHPLIGVGAGNYANSTVHFLFDAGAIQRPDFIVDKPKPAHNVYLQALAELGIVGLALFLGIIGFSLQSLLRTARVFRRAGSRSMEVLSRGLLIGLCGLLASAFFSTAIYSKQLWLLLALSVTLGAMARDRAAPDQPRTRRAARA